MVGLQVYARVGLDFASVQRDYLIVVQPGHRVGALVSNAALKSDVFARLSFLFERDAHCLDARLVEDAICVAGRRNLVRRLGYRTAASASAAAYAALASDCKRNYYLNKKAKDSLFLLFI